MAGVVLLVLVAGLVVGLALRSGAPDEVASAGPATRSTASTTDPAPVPTTPTPAPTTTTTGTAPTPSAPTTAAPTTAAPTTTAAVPTTASPAPPAPPVATTTPRTPAPSAAPSPATVQVVVPIASWNGSTSDVEFSAYAAGVVEADGSCTVTMTRGSERATGSAQALPDVTTTSCGDLRVAGSAVSSGTWVATITYSSPRSRGTSDPVEVDVP